MQITITGASGFVGRHLTRAMLDQGHIVTGIGRSTPPPFTNDEQLHWIQADTTRPGPWQEAVSHADVIVNLTGKSIFGYWTERLKSEIYTTRIETTRHIAAALSDTRPAVLLNTSAIGYYGDRGDSPLTEAEPPGNDFLASVCIDWEKEALAAEKKGSRVVLMRFGVVLGKNGGALKQMIPAFKFFAGGPLGNGNHWFPWIHMDDLISAVFFAVETPELSGPVNFSAPEPIQQRTFARELGNALGRPAFMPTPGFMLKMVLGEMSDALMSSQKAVPDALVTRNFQFKFPRAAQALADLVS